MLPVSAINRHLAFEAEQCGQFSGCLDEGRGNVDAGHPALETRCEIACWPAETTTNVKDVMVSLHGQPVGQIDRGGKTARMEMIDRRQIFYTQVLRRLSRFFQRGQDQRRSEEHTS